MRELKLLSSPCQRCGQYHDDDEPIVAARETETVPSPPNNALADALGAKPHPLAEQLSRGRSSIGPAPKHPPSTGTNPPPSLTEAIKKKRSK